MRLEMGVSRNPRFQKTQEETQENVHMLVTGNSILPASLSPSTAGRVGQVHGWSLSWCCAVPWRAMLWGEVYISLNYKETERGEEQQSKQQPLLFAGAPAQIRSF